MIVEIVLIVIIILLLGIMLFYGGGIFKRRRILAELSDLREETRRLRDANEALRATYEIKGEDRVKRAEEFGELVRDLETLRSAIAGSSSCKEKLLKKYNLEPGPELVDKIIASEPKIDVEIKRRLADELLVGEVGRAIMRSLSTSASIEKAAGDADVPLVIARTQVTRLRTLGYLNAQLKLTELGWRSLS